MKRGLVVLAVAAVGARRARGGLRTRHAQSSVPVTQSRVETPPTEVGSTSTDPSRSRRTRCAYSRRTGRSSRGRRGDRGRQERRRSRSRASPRAGLHGALARHRLRRPLARRCLHVRRGRRGATADGGRRLAGTTWRDDAARWAFFGALALLIGPLVVRLVIIGAEVPAAPRASVPSGRGRRDVPRDRRRDRRVHPARVERPPASDHGAAIRRPPAVRREDAVRHRLPRHDARLRDRRRAPVRQLDLRPALAALAGAPAGARARLGPLALRTPGDGAELLVPRRDRGLAAPRRRLDLGRRRRDARVPRLAARARPAADRVPRVRAARGGPRRRDGARRRVPRARSGSRR